MKSIGSLFLFAQTAVKMKSRSLHQWKSPHASFMQSFYVQHVGLPCQKLNWWTLTKWWTPHSSVWNMLSGLQQGGIRWLTWPKILFRHHLLWSYKLQLYAKKWRQCSSAFRLTDSEKNTVLLFYWDVHGVFPPQSTVMSCWRRPRPSMWLYFAVVCIPFPR